jgi:predicted TIM-barrel enzyme
MRERCFDAGSSIAANTTCSVGVARMAGLNGVDPLRDMRLFLEECRRIGFSGVHNFPTVAWFDGEFRRTLEGTGLGYEHEIRMLVTARELLGYWLTSAYVDGKKRTGRLVLRRVPLPARFASANLGGR